MNNAPEKISVWVTHTQADKCFYYGLDCTSFVSHSGHKSLPNKLMWMCVSYRYFGEDVEDERQNRHVCAYSLASKAFSQVFRHGHHTSRDVHRDKDPTQCHQDPWCLHRHTHSSYKYILSVLSAIVLFFPLLSIYRMHCTKDCHNVWLSTVLPIQSHSSLSII